MSTYTTKVLLYRALMHPATKEAKGDPDSNLCVWLPDALAAFAEFTNFLSQITTNDLNGFWGRRMYFFQRLSSVGKELMLTLPYRCSVAADYVRQLSHISIPYGI